MRNSKNKYLPPCVFQGGKQRLAEQICDIIESNHKGDFVFYDICCGSGSVGLEMLNRGHKIVLIDKGLYGLFWEQLSQGVFDLNVFKNEIDKLPETKDVQSYLRNLSLQPINNDLIVYHYLLLQAGAFGGKQIWASDGKWKNNTFRSYWQPTPTSNRQSPVQPMIPVPQTMLQRVENLCNIPKGYLTAYHKDILDCIDVILQDKRNKVVYIDPPYMNTTGYYEKLDIYSVIEKLGTESPLYISEGVILDGFDSVILSNGRKKGNINGNVKKKPVVEVLNFKL